MGQKTDNLLNFQGTMKKIRPIFPVYSFLILFSIMVIGCAKRETKPAPNSDKIEIDKKDLLELVDEDLKTEEALSDKARFQTEIIMPGDRIQVTVYEKLPVSQEPRVEMKRVDETGSIFLLPVGAIKMEGLSLVKAEKLIEEKFSKLVVSPHCEIQILEKQYEPRVYVFGEVGKSGLITFKSGDRLLDAISSAGGCSDNAYKRSIKIIRANKETISIYSIDLYDIMKSGNIYKNMSLHDQDIVFVPRRFITGFREVITVLNAVLPWWLIVRTFY